MDEIFKLAQGLQFSNELSVKKLAKAYLELLRDYETLYDSSGESLDDRDSDKFRTGFLKSYNGEDL